MKEARGEQADIWGRVRRPGVRTLSHSKEGLCGWHGVSEDSEEMKSGHGILHRIFVKADGDNE